jgi:hypothetical protein
MSEVSEEKLPVHESIEVIEHINLYKTEKWWAAVVLSKSFGNKDVSLYQWMNRQGAWKRQSRWKIKNQSEWLAIKEAVEKLLPSIS